MVKCTDERFNFEHDKQDFARVVNGIVMPGKRPFSHSEELTPSESSADEDTYSEGGISELVLNDYVVGNDGTEEDGDAEEDSDTEENDDTEEYDDTMKDDDDAYYDTYYDAHDECGVYSRYEGYEECEGCDQSEKHWE